MMDHVGGPKPTDDEIRSGWPWLRFLYHHRPSQAGVRRAVVLGIVGQWEDRGVTEDDLIRLGLVEPEQDIPVKCA